MPAKLLVNVVFLNTRWRDFWREFAEKIRKMQIFLKKITFRGTH